jgi:hypothetical protein
MLTERTLQVFFVGKDEGPIAPSRPQSEAMGESTMKKASLDEIAREAAFLWVPQYLPTDFMLTSSLWNRNPDVVELTYRNVRSTLQVPILIISEFRKARLSLVDGYSESVAIKGRDGFMVHGGWVQHIGDSVRWVTEGIKRAICDLGDGVAMLTSFGQDQPDDSTLVRIAESLERY